VTDLAWVLLGVTAVVAVVDWWAVTSGHIRVEWLAKPLVMVGLLAAMLALDDVDRGVWAWFLIAFVFGLLGDVFLLGPDRLFPAGLGSFLIAHLCAIVGLLVAGVGGGWLLLGAAIVLVALVAVAPKVVVGATAHGLRVPVVAYLVVLGAMTAIAVGTGEWWAAAGGVLFLVSDAILGWNRFARPFAWSRPAVHVTYHLAQAAFLLFVAST
jgi:uncharacterized membrane protein YhhN